MLKNVLLSVASGLTQWIVIICITSLDKPPFNTPSYIRSCLARLISYFLFESIALSKDEHVKKKEAPGRIVCIYIYIYIKYEMKERGRVKVGLLATLLLFFVTHYSITPTT